MNKIIAGLICVALVAMLIIGALLAGRGIMQSAEVQKAIARQEQANAARLEADADKARALAAQAWTDARAKSEAQPEIAASVRWYALGGGMAFFVLMVGGAFALVGYLNIRSRTVYPNERGQYPIVVSLLGISGEKGVAVLDTSRMLNASTAIDEKGNQIGEQPSEETALRIATQAQQAALMLGVARSNTKGELIEKIKSATDAMAGLMLSPQFGKSSEPMPTLRPPVSEAELERLELAEFLKQGATVRGWARATWIGSEKTKPFRFRTGRECRRKKYDLLIGRLENANILAKEGNSHRLDCELTDAYAVLGWEDGTAGQDGTG